jgi:hypothetical protein
VSFVGFSLSSSHRTPTSGVNTVSGGYGVYGVNNAGAGYGVYGQATGASSIGVFGLAAGTPGSRGVEGNGNVGVRAYCNSTAANVGIGLNAIHSQPGGTAILANG